MGECQAWRKVLEGWFEKGRIGVDWILEYAVR
jgi:hypothetical protein